MERFELTSVRRFFFQLLYLVAILDLVYENLSRFEAWNKMFVNNQCGITRNISGNLFLPFFVDKTSETPDVNVIAI